MHVQRCVKISYSACEQVLVLVQCRVGTGSVPLYDLHSASSSISAFTVPGICHSQSLRPEFLGSLSLQRSWLVTVLEALLFIFDLKYFPLWLSSGPI